MRLKGCFERAREAGPISTIANEDRILAADEGCEESVVFNQEVLGDYLIPWLSGRQAPLFAVAPPWEIVVLHACYTHARLPPPFTRRERGICWVTPFSLAGDPIAVRLLKEDVWWADQLLELHGKRLRAGGVELGRKDATGFTTAARLRLVSRQLDGRHDPYYCAVLPRDQARTIAEFLNSRSTTYPGRGGKVRVIHLNDPRSLSIQKKADELVTTEDDAGAKLAEQLRFEKVRPLMKDFVTTTARLRDERPAETARVFRDLKLIRSRNCTDRLGKQKSAEKTVRATRTALGLPGWRESHGSESG